MFSAIFLALLEVRGKKKKTGTVMRFMASNSSFDLENGGDEQIDEGGRKGKSLSIPSATASFPHPSCFRSVKVPLVFYFLELYIGQ